MNTVYWAIFAIIIVLIILLIIWLVWFWNTRPLPINGSEKKGWSWSDWWGGDSNKNKLDVTSYNHFSEMERLWLDHAYLTRQAVIETAANYPGAKVTATTFALNAPNLGNNLAYFHGKENGDKYGNLLGIHI